MVKFPFLYDTSAQSRRLSINLRLLSPFRKAAKVRGVSGLTVTKTNWEGTGVEPDVKVAASDALTRAQALAMERILKKDNK
jgi:hypothetical protein